VTALTDALVVEGVPVGIGKRPTVAVNKPFIVIWPDAGLRSAVTMKANDGLAETWTCHCYGLTEESAAVALRELTTAVYALWRTEVDGRLVQYPEQLSALPLSVDRDADPDLYDYAVEWRFRTSAT
jgi:hypothetical protein